MRRVAVAAVIVGALLVVPVAMGGDTARAKDACVLTAALEHGVWIDSPSTPGGKVLQIDYRTFSPAEAACGWIAIKAIFAPPRFTG